MTYLVFMRNAAGDVWYLYGDTDTGCAFTYTQDRAKAQRCSREACSRYMRALVGQLPRGWAPGFEGT